MLRCNNYVFAESLEQAYELNQKRNNTIIGGNGWIKMGNKQWNTAIDISRLGLDKIEENDNEYKIGAMVSLRELEKNNSLNCYTDGAVKEALKHIVGTQFRNTVTIGGSIYSRFGFSDPLTMLLVLDSYAELYKGGRVAISDYVNMAYDNDIITHIIIKKTPLKTAYDSFRNQSTDFPVIACSIAVTADDIRVAVGARPLKAGLITHKKDINASELALFVCDNFSFGSNMRASAEYRRALTEVIIKRLAEKVGV